jgi:hypothetical protein
VKEVTFCTVPPKGSKRITRQSPKLEFVVSVKVLSAVPTGTFWTETNLELDQIIRHEGPVPATFAQTVLSVSRTLKTVFGVVQSPA